MNKDPVSDEEIKRAFPLFRGALLRPRDAGYDEHRRGWNLMFDHKPSLIARCSGAADVRDVVNFARDSERLLAIRGAGHSIAGKSGCDDGVILDLGLMRQARVDLGAQTMRVEGGATWGDSDREAQAFGLANPGGALSMTGVAGTTLGGGFGWLGRRYGLALDNVKSMDVVLASGEQVSCDDETHPDLYWALRGGGGNFGVVVSFEYRLHPITSPLLTGILGWPANEAADVIRHYAPLAPDLPREIGLNLQMVLAPPMGEIPEELHGRPILILIYAYHGEDHERGKQAIATMREFGPPAFDTTGTMSFLELQRSNDFRCPPTRNCWQGGYLDELEPAIETIIEHFESAPSGLCLSEFLTMSGAIAAVPDGATAFGRRSGWVYNVITMWHDEADDERFIGWARRYHEALASYPGEGAYINFFSSWEDDRLVEAYGETKLQRLAAIKRVYDPDNLFRVNHNIAPARS